MCGIVGSLGPVDGPDPWVAGALATVAHRGPDDEGCSADGPLTLGFRRLAVVAPGPAGAQPMTSNDGRWTVVCNGELYEADADGPDTAALLDVLVHHGPAAALRLRGMFAFLAWDAAERVLYAGRDPFGIKPLAYAWNEAASRLRLASEPKALREGGRPPPVDREGLRRYLRLQYVPGPATITPAVSVLPPGHLLRARPGRRPSVRPVVRPLLRPARCPDAGRPAAIREALRSSVRAHLRSDVPVGAFLSGGVDSAALCALAAEVVPDLPTFTIGFEGAEGSEVPPAAETAAALGLRHTAVVVGPDEVRECLPRIVWHLDDPLGDASAVALWFLAREARRAVTVVLSGEGADELFGGYRIYGSALDRGRFDGLAERSPEPLRRAVARLAGALPEGRWRRSLTHLATARYLGPARISTAAQVDALTGAGPLAEEGVAGIARRARRLGLDPLAAAQLVDLSTWLPGDILVKADRASMAHGLELRVPFLDREVLAAASPLTAAEKLAGGTTKVALREAVAPLVPAAVATRPKAGFPLPVGRWLRGPLAGFVDDVLEGAQTDEHLRRPAVRELVARHRAGEDDDWRPVWALLCFSLWHQVVVEDRYDAVALGWAPPAGRRVTT